jgi:hypothetical protein
MAFFTTRTAFSVLIFSSDKGSQPMPQVNVLIKEEVAHQWLSSSRVLSIKRPSLHHILSIFL